MDEVPIFVAGGIATGAYIAHLLLMGAAGVQLGTFFVLTDECRTHLRFKEALIRAKARAAVATPQVGSELKVVAVRALRRAVQEGDIDFGSGHGRPERGPGGPDSAPGRGLGLSPGGRDEKELEKIRGRILGL